MQLNAKWFMAAFNFPGLPKVLKHFFREDITGETCGRSQSSYRTQQGLWVHVPGGDYGRITNSKCHGHVIGFRPFVAAFRCTGCTLVSGKNV